MRNDGHGHPLLYMSRIVSRAKKKGLTNRSVSTSPRLPLRKHLNILPRMALFSLVPFPWRNATSRMGIRSRFLPPLPPELPPRRLLFDFSRISSFFLRRWRERRRPDRRTPREFRTDLDRFAKTRKLFVKAWGEIWLKSCVYVRVLEAVDSRTTSAASASTQM